MAVSKYVFVILFSLGFSQQLKSESVNLKPKKTFTCPSQNSCSCRPVDDVIMFECDQGSKGLQYTITINNTKDELVMDCRCATVQDCSTMYRPGMFADFNVKSIESVHFMSCPLPNISYSQLLGDLDPMELSISTYVGEIELLQQFLFANLSDVLELTIKNGKINSLEENVFEDLVGLQHLDLSLNMLRKLPDGIFNKTQNLTHLTLYGNSLSELPKIHILPNLEILNLNSNRFANLSENYFDFSPNLRNLSLTHNRLTHLSPNALHNLVNLTSLDLTYNELTDLPNQLFQSNENLEELRIRLNLNLSELPQDLLSATKSLEILDLGRNNISTLPEKLLNKLPNLNFLDLSRNRLETIPETFFANSTGLTSVDLSVNRLSILPNNVFKPLENIRAINLYNNKLKSIGQDLFSNLPALNSLDLSNNELEVIQDEAFSGSDNITWMDFTSNLIRFDTEPFTLPPALEHLNFTHNQITYLPPKWSKAKNLHNLNLTENVIQSVNSEQLDYKTSVVLDLTHNHIATINLQDIDKTRSNNDTTIEKEVPSIPTILISFNPMNCDCNLLQFVHYLKTRNSHDPKAPFQFVADNLTCALPRDSITTFQPLTTVQEDTLYCNLDQQCSALCQCRKTPVSGITEVHCEGKKLSEVIHRVPPNTSKAYFDKNRITSITALQNPKWAMLTEAHFSVNEISNIETKIELPKLLKVLTLDGNKLTNFPQWLMDAVDKSKWLSVTLRNNSWACDCSALPFYHWLQSAPPGKINDIGDVRCGPGPFYQKKLIAHDFVQFCPPEEDSSSSSAIVVTVLTLLILFSALAFGAYCARRHKFEIKMWLFRHRLCLWLRTEDDIESGHPL